MNKKKTQILNVITDVYNKCKVNNKHTEQGFILELLDDKFDKIDRITFHGMIDIVINMEIKYCKDIVKLNDTKKLQNHVKEINTVIGQLQANEYKNVLSARNRFLNNLENIITNVSDIAIDTMLAEYHKSTSIWSEQENLSVTNIIEFEHQRVAKKKKKLKEFLKTHNNIYWSKLGCTDYLTPFKNYETIHDFLEGFTIEICY